MVAKKKSKKKAVKASKKAKRTKYRLTKRSSARKSSKRRVMPRRLSVEPKNVVVVYGMRIDPETITRSAVEAYHKRRYTVHDLRLTEHIPDPKFRNLMVKIAVLDRIEEELLRLYPAAHVMRPNTVTLIVR